MKEPEGGAGWSLTVTTGSGSVDGLETNTSAVTGQVSSGSLSLQMAAMIAFHLKLRVGERASPVAPSPASRPEPSPPAEARWLPASPGLAGEPHAPRRAAVQARARRGMRPSYLARGASAER